MSISPTPPRAKMKRKILDHMREHYRAHGAFPSRRQIAAAMDRKPNGYISRVVDQLREKGHLRAIERARQ